MIGNGHTEPATPNDEKQAEILISNVEEFIYDPEVQQQLLAKMGEGDPASAIGGITGQLLHMQMVVADGSGQELSRDILLAVAAEVINALIEMAMQEGIIQVQGEQQLEQIQGDALIAAVDAYMQLGDSKVNGEAASRMTEGVMGGQMDSPEAQQGMIGNMVGQPPQQGPPQQGPPQQGPPTGGPPMSGGTPNGY
jgi:hypothetical protein